MKAPDIIYTDGRNTYASAPIFSNIDGNVKYIRADLAEQPSLPSNLDEAANKYGFKETSERLREGGITRKNEGMFRWQIEKAFKAGAEWMAGQGVTKEAVIGTATEEISINVSEQTLNELDLCPGDKVVVQIRKKYHIIE